jgi:hypothetical protein
MSGKDAAIGTAVILAVIGVAVYVNHQTESGQLGPLKLGPPAYVDGPNAGSEECKKLTQEWGSMLERQSNEDTQAENRDNAQTDRIMRSQMTESQREKAMNNQTAKEDIAKTAREARQRSEEIDLRAREREAGCLVSNPNFSK